MSLVAAFVGQVRMAARSDTVRLLAAAAAVGYALVAAFPASFRLSAICGRVSPEDAVELLGAGTVFPSALALAAEWAAMSLAMMPLLVARPVAHVRHCSLPRRRPRAVLLFAIAYGLCWMAAGLVLAPLALALGVVFGSGVAVAFALTAALAWSASPWAQSARNGCHRMRRIGAFGPAADADCLRQGLATGLSCVGTCWPWALLCASVGTAHVAAMAVVTLVVLVDRLGPPTEPRWRFPPAFSLTKLRYFHS